jgi:hypothetical protein
MCYLVGYLLRHMEHDRPCERRRMAAAPKIVEPLLGEAHLTHPGRAAKSDSSISGQVRSATRESVCQCTGWPQWMVHATSKTHAGQ